jgi:hypothetical protein
MWIVDSATTTPRIPIVSVATARNDIVAGPGFIDRRHPALRRDFEPDQIERLRIRLAPVDHYSNIDLGQIMTDDNLSRKISSYLFGQQIQHSFVLAWSVMRKNERLCLGSRCDFPNGIARRQGVLCRTSKMLVIHFHACHVAAVNQDVSTLREPVYAFTWDRIATYDDCFALGFKPVAVTIPAAEKCRWQAQTVTMNDRIGRNFPAARIDHQAGCNVFRHYRRPSAKRRLPF